MTTEQKIRKPYLKKLIIWILIVAALSAICMLYHSSPSARFHPLISAALIALFSVWILFAFEIPKYLRDRCFSGKIVEMSIKSRKFAQGAVDKSVDKRTVVTMKIECDCGKILSFEQTLPSHLTRAVPYRVGDRVLHLKGAPYTCRFPRNDTETVYDPISVICPICGALLPLGSKECSFCETELPRDHISEKNKSVSE